MSTNNYPKTMIIGKNIEIARNPEEWLRNVVALMLTRAEMRGEVAPDVTERMAEDFADLAASSVLVLDDDDGRILYAVNPVDEE